MSGRRIGCVFFVAASLGALCVAADELGGPVRRVVLADGQAADVRLLPWTNDVCRVQDGGAVREIPLGNLVKWGAAADVERGAQVFLTDGSVLVGDIVRQSGEDLTLGDAAGLGRGMWQDVRLPLPHVRGILLQPSADPLIRDRQAANLTNASGKQDEFTLVGGEKVAGVLLAATTNSETKLLDRFRLQVRGLSKPLEIAPAKTIALGFNASFAAPVRGKRRMLCVLNDGSRLSIASLQADKDGVELELSCGLKLRPTMDDADQSAGFARQVRFLQSDSPRVQFLSDVPPVEFHHTPALTTAWPLGRDANVLGGRLRSGEVCFLRGLGTHAASAISYDVPPTAERFEAEVFIDRAAGGRGSVQFAVLLEINGVWSEAFLSPILRGGDPPLPVIVPLPNAKRLRLETRLVDRGDQGDHGNWGDARWIKTP